MSRSLLSPLVVDLDGTLIHSDLLTESALDFFFKKPLSVFLLFKWLLAGKANLKWQLAKVTKIDVTSLPYNQQVIDLIKAERQKGRSIILATASHITYAKQIADHLKLFDRIFATEGAVNLSAQNKCDKLVLEFGENGFDYVGNSCDDLCIWDKAKSAYIVNPSFVVSCKIKSFKNINKIITTPKNLFKTWAKELRLHQWVKNFLIFVPLLASHKLNQIELLINGFWAFLFFGLCASHVYLFNDLVDLKNDRHHTTKRFRPLAAGLISIPAALITCFTLLFFALAGTFYILPLWFSISLIAYYILTLSYSVFLKRVIMLDIITLAALYSMRIIAGAFAMNLTLTFWILAFSMFIFLSLSLVKRYAELYEQRSKGKQEIIHGRAYYPSDLEILSSLGASSGYLSVMVLALYLQDEATIVLYSHPRIIWFACPLFLYWISRIWMLTHRGLMHDDPVVFAIKDQASWLIGILLSIIFWLAA